MVVTWKRKVIRVLPVQMCIRDRLKGGDKDLQPDFSGKEYLLERQLKPEARRDIIQKLAEEGIQPTSMMRCV